MAGSARLGGPGGAYRDEPRMVTVGQGDVEGAGARGLEAGGWWPWIDEG
jgi:hypothetical protein